MVRFGTFRDIRESPVIAPVAHTRHGLPEFSQGAALPDIIHSIQSGAMLPLRVRVEQQCVWVLSNSSALGNKVLAIYSVGPYIGPNTRHAAPKQIGGGMDLFKNSHITQADHPYCHVSASSLHISTPSLCSLSGYFYCLGFCEPILRAVSRTRSSITKRGRDDQTLPPVSDLV